MIINLAMSLLLLGMYGVPSVSGMPSDKRVELLAGLQGVNAVFTPADGETIRFFKERGYRVYVTVNAFGGSAAWKEFPDSRPVLEDGRKLGESAAQNQGGVNPGGVRNQAREAAIADGSLNGGICPTHEGWRAARLREISDLLDRFGAKDKSAGDKGDSVAGKGRAADRENVAIDGIWLDFIRYPGVWENTETEAEYVRKLHAETADVANFVTACPGVADPGKSRLPTATTARALPLGIPDAGYCPRCLAKFSRDTGIVLPMPLERTAEASAWLHKSRPYEWMDWKKQQINSFAGDVRALIGKKGASPVLLGAFTVPWTKGEKGGAATYLLGQDPFALSEIVDVLSPMVYHRMVGKDTAWVGELTRYYTEQAKCAVWPIIQSEETPAAEFADAARYAGLGGAQGLIVYTHRHMDAAKRQALASFRIPENLIETNRDRALFISNACPGEIHNCQIIENQGSVPVYAAAMGEWRMPVSVCEPGQAYQLSCLFDRKTWNELSRSYASVWGQRFLLEKHLPANVMQPLSVTVVCPQAPADQFFRFTNEISDDCFYLSEPKLVRTLPIPAPAPAPHNGFFYPGFFPIGVYGAAIDDLKEAHKLAINTAIIGGDGEHLKRAIAECRRLGIRYVVSPPHDPGRLAVYLERLSGILNNDYDTGLAFYVEDEPEMRAIPPGRTADVQRLIKARFPQASTGMATVRPSYSREYQQGSDFFMIDNYPFPNMPMSWLGDSMDRAAQEVGRDRLVSVIQAFSEKEGEVWPSMPGWRQIDSLAFLSIVHGSRGIFFYTWSDIGKSKEGRANLGRVVGRLNHIYPWLLEKNLQDKVGVEMLSEYRFDPKGRPGVHAALKKKGNERMLIAVNTLGAPVDVRLDGFTVPPERVSATGFVTARDVFSGADYPVVNGAITTSMKPYESKAFIIRETEPNYFTPLAKPTIAQPLP